MSRRPFGVITTTDPGAVPLPAGWRAIGIGELPFEPFDLTEMRLAVATSVSTDQDAVSVLMAAARGCGVVLELAMDRRAADEFVDSLGRLVHVGDPTEPVTLDAEQTLLLERLAGGLTMVDAARQLGWSRRTATRRLADAKRRLGVSSTSKAIQALRAAS